jgi:regulatory protein YycI of two-component signal transduction system YycFG
MNNKYSSKNSKKSMDKAINSNLQRGNKYNLENIQNKNGITSLNNIINEDT